MCRWSKFTFAALTVALGCGHAPLGSAEKQAVARFRPFVTATPEPWSVDRRARTKPAVGFPEVTLAPLPTSSAWNLSCSPDGKHIAATLDDGRLVLMDQQARILLSLSKAASNIKTLRFSRDGRHLLTVTHAGRVEVWNLTSGRRMFTVQKPPHTAASLCGSGTTLISAYPDDRGTTVEFWSLSDNRSPALRRHLADTEIPQDTPDALACHPNQPSFALASERGVAIHDLGSGRRIAQIVSPTGPGSRLDYRPDGKRLAFTAGDHLYLADPERAAILSLTQYRTSFSPRFSASSRVLTVEERVYDAEHLEELTRIPLGISEACTLGSPERLIHVSGGGLVSVTLTSLLERPTLTGHLSSPRAMRFDPSGRWLAVADEDAVLVWDMRSGRVAWQFPGGGMGTSGIHFDFDGHLYLIESDTVVKRELVTGSRVHSWRFADSIERVSLTTDSSEMLIFGSRRGAVLKPRNPGNPRTALVPSFANSLASPYGQLSPLGQVVAIASNEPEGTRLFSSTTGQIVRQFPPGSIVAFTPDGMHLAIAASDTLSVYSVATGETLASEDIQADTLDFTPDGTCIGWGNHSYEVGIWCWRDARAQVSRFEAPWHVYAVAFTPDGRHLFSGGADRAIHGWEVASGTRVRMLPTGPSTGSRGRLAFTPDGEGLATCTPDGNVRTVDLDTGRVTATYLRDQNAHPEARALTPGAQTAADCGALVVSDTDRVVAMNLSGQMRLWTEPGPAARVVDPQEHINSLGEVAFHDDELAAITSGYDDLQLYSLTSLQPRTLRDFEHTEVRLLRFSPDGSKLTFITELLVDRTTSLHLVDTRSLKDIQPPVPMHSVSGLDFVDGERIVIIGKTSADVAADQAADTDSRLRIHVWNLAARRIEPAEKHSFAPRWTFATNPVPRPDVHVSTRHGIIVILDGDQLRVFDAGDGSYKTGLTVLRDTHFEELVVHPQHTLIAAADMDGYVYVWDFRSGRIKLEFHGYNDSDWRTHLANGDWSFPATSPRFSVNP